MKQNTKVTRAGGLPQLLRSQDVPLLGQRRSAGVVALAAQGDDHETRISAKDLKGAVSLLNRITDMPQEPWTKDSTFGNMTANIGNYYLSGAYGGWQVERMVNGGGGSSTPLETGYVSKRECYNAVHAFIRGFETATND